MGNTTLVSEDTSFITEQDTNPQTQTEEQRITALLDFVDRQTRKINDNVKHLNDFVKRTLTEKDKLIVRQYYSGNGDSRNNYTYYLKEKE